MQPGYSGNSIRNPPPSSCSSGRISKRGSSFVIVLSNPINQFEEPLNVYCPDGLVCRHRKGRDTWIAERDMTGSRLPPVNPISDRLGFETIDTPIVTRVVSHWTNLFLRFAHVMMASYMVPMARRALTPTGQDRYARIPETQSTHRQFGHQLELLAGHKFRTPKFRWPSSSATLAPMFGLHGDCCRFAREPAPVPGMPEKCYDSSVHARKHVCVC